MLVIVSSAGRARRFFLPGLLFCVLSACVGADWRIRPQHENGRPELPRPDVVPGRQGQAANGAPQATLAPKLLGKGLLHILARVDALAPALQAALAEARARQAEASAARAGYWGEVTPFASSDYLDAPRLVNPLSPPININTAAFDDRQYHLGLQASIPLDLSGHLSAQVRRAEAGQRAAQANAAATRLRLLHQAASLYRSLQGLQGRKHALELQRDALDAHLRIAKEAIRVGRMAEVDALRLQAERDAVLGQLAALTGQDASLRAALAALMHIDKYRDPVDTDAAAPQASQHDPLAWQQRPSLRAMRERIDAAAEAVRTAAAARLPQVGIRGNYSYNSGYSADGDGIGQIGAFAAWPIFDGGRRSSVERAARARYEASVWLWQQKRDEAQAAELSARAAWQAAKQRFDAARTAVAAARKTARIQEQRFGEGRLSATDLVDVEAALQRAEAEQSTAMASWWSADDAVQHAAGRAPAGYIKIDFGEKRGKPAPAPGPRP